MTFFAVLMLLATLTSSYGFDSILRNDFETPSAVGTYKWAIQTDGGIYHEERSSSVEQGPIVQGQYQYTAPDGQVINVVYSADGNGFRAEGAHLPTPPPVPPQIQRALQYIAKQTASQ